MTPLREKTWARDELLVEVAAASPLRARERWAPLWSWSVDGFEEAPQERQVVGFEGSGCRILTIPNSAKGISAANRKCDSKDDTYSVAFLELSLVLLILHNHKLQLLLE